MTLICVCVDFKCTLSIIFVRELALNLWCGVRFLSRVKASAAYLCPSTSYLIPACPAAMTARGTPHGQAALLVKTEAV